MRSALCLPLVAVALIFGRLSYGYVSWLTAAPAAPCVATRPISPPSLQINASGMSTVILWVNGSEPAWLRAREWRCVSFYRSQHEESRVEPSMALASRR